MMRVYIDYPAGWGGEYGFTTQYDEQVHVYIEINDFDDLHRLLAISGGIYAAPDHTVRLRPKGWLPK